MENREKIEKNEDMKKLEEKMEKVWVEKVERGLMKKDMEIIIGKDKNWI